MAQTRSAKATNSLGTTPVFRKFGKLSSSDHSTKPGTILLADGQTEDPLTAERFRMLAASIEQKGNGCENPPKVLLITSATPEDGKSFTAVNLARAIADASGRKTLLLDCDFRCPVVDQYFQLGKTEGITDLLSHEKALSQSDSAAKPILSLVRKQHASAEFHSTSCPTRSDVQLSLECPNSAVSFSITFSSMVHKFGPNLHVISSGKANIEASHAANSSLLSELIQVCRKHFDYMIIDCSPILLAPEPLIMGPMVDSSLLVRPWKTERHLVEESLDTFGRNKFLGVVINDAADMMPKRYYRKYYG